MVKKAKITIFILFFIQPLSFISCENDDSMSENIPTVESNEPSDQPEVATTDTVEPSGELLVNGSSNANTGSETSGNSDSNETVESIKFSIPSSSVEYSEIEISIEFPTSQMADRVNLYAKSNIDTEYIESECEKDNLAFFCSIDPINVIYPEISFYISLQYSDGTSEQYPENLNYSVIPVVDSIEKTSIETFTTASAEIYPYNRDIYPYQDAEIYAKYRDENGNTISAKCTLIIDGLEIEMDYIESEVYEESGYVASVTKDKNGSFTYEIRCFDILDYYDPRKIYGILNIDAEYDGILPSEIGESITKSGFYKIHKDNNNRYWFMTPDGKLSFLKGMNKVNFEVGYTEEDGNGYLKNYYDGDEAKWAKETVERLKEWGFNGALNSISGHIKEQFPYLYLLEFTTWEMNNGLEEHPDPWVEGVFDGVKEKIEKLKDDPLLIAYQLGNEFGLNIEAPDCPKYLGFDISWLNGWIRDMIDLTGTDPDLTPAKKEFVEHLKEVYNDDVNLLQYYYEIFLTKKYDSTLCKKDSNNKIDSFDELYLLDFDCLYGGLYNIYGNYSLKIDTCISALDLHNRDGEKICYQRLSDLHGYQYKLAKQAFNVMTDTIRSIDTNHLITGYRVASCTDNEVWQAMEENPYIDAYSINAYPYYDGTTTHIDNTTDYFGEMYKSHSRDVGLARPIIHSEFTYLLDDTLGPNFEKEYYKNCYTIYSEVTTPEMRKEAYYQVMKAMVEADLDDEYFMIGTSWYQLFDIDWYNIKGSGFEKGCNPYEIWGFMGADNDPYNSVHAPLTEGAKEINSGIHQYILENAEK